MQKKNYLMYLVYYLIEKYLHSTTGIAYHLMLPSHAIKSGHGGQNHQRLSLICASFYFSTISFPAIVFSICI